MSPEQREIQRERSRQWYLKNKDNPDLKRRSALWAKNNKEKRKVANQKYRHKNKATKQQMRIWSWKSNGIPTPTRPEPKACECCGLPATRTLHVDHDHTTGEFRGWLCQQCNCALGLVGDSVSGVQKLLAYITRNINLKEIT